MKAAVYVRTDSGKVLQIQDVPKPKPRDNEVLLKVRAASVNPVDWRLKKYRPGMDVSGEVEAAGMKVTRFKPGDAVFGTCRGAFAEYACASEASLAHKPESLSFEQAASIPIAGLTALQGLRDKGHLRPGEKVLINGAAGGVGTFSVQIAKALGAQVTGVCSTPNLQMVHSLGADRLVDYTHEDFTQSGERYDLLLDNVGNRSLSALRGVLTSNGRCMLAGAPKQMGAALVRVAKAFLWSPFVRQKFTFFIARIRPEDLRALCILVEKGQLTPAIDKQYSLADTAAAVAYAENGHARAKVIIVPL